MNIQFNQFFQLLSDDTRLRCLLLMQQEGELCVCELVHALGLIQPKVSRHLAALRDAGVVTDRRSGQWIYYQINPDLPAWAHQVIEAIEQDRLVVLGLPGRPAPCVVVLGVEHELPVLVAVDVVQSQYRKRLMAQHDYEISKAGVKPDTR